MAKADGREVFEGVVTVLRSKLRVQAPLGPKTNLLRDLQFDSVQLLTLVVELENHFQLCFEPGDEAGLATLEDIAARIVALRERDR
ncbi:MAG TPA: acyl carrier protein [Myxococcales bacterium]|jgi:acyl carrier protein